MHKHDSHNWMHVLRCGAYRSKNAAKGPNPLVRAFCMVLACIMVVSLLAGGIACQGAHAAAIVSGQCGEDVWWEFDDATGTLIIRGQGAMWDFESLQEILWAEFAGTIQKIVIHSGVTAIGKNAFVGCTVQEVEFPDTLTEIRENAFLNCEKLAAVDLSQTQIARVEAKAFSGCRELRTEAVLMPETVTFVDETAFDEEPAEPAENPAEPVAEPTQPAGNPPEPTVEPTQPAGNPPEPTVEPTQPAENPTEPAGESAKKFYKIKTYGTYAYDVDGVLHYGDEFTLSAEKYYDADGRLIEDNQFNSDGMYYFTRYDADTGYMTGYYYSDQEYNPKREYDASGRLIRTTYFSGDGSVSAPTDYEYDESGRLIAADSYSLPGMHSYSRFVYDEKGNLAEERSYHDKTDMINNPDSFFYVRKYERQYDTAGNLVSCAETYRRTGEELKTNVIDTYRYDDEGRLAEKVVEWYSQTTDGSGSVLQLVDRSEYEYKYDADGRLAEEIVGRSMDYSDGTSMESLSKCEYHYDTEGRLTGYTNYSAEGYKTGYSEVEYDAVPAAWPTESTGEQTESTEGGDQPGGEQTESTEGGDQPGGEQTGSTEGGDQTGGEQTGSTEGTAQTGGKQTGSTEGTAQTGGKQTESTEGTVQTGDQTGDQTDLTEEAA